MKKLILFALISLFVLPPAAHAESREVQITDTMHRNFDGTFRNDDLAKEIAVGGTALEFDFFYRFNASHLGNRCRTH